MEERVEVGAWGGGDGCWAGAAGGCPCMVEARKLPLLEVRGGIAEGSERGLEDARVPDEDDAVVVVGVECVASGDSTVAALDGPILCVKMVVQADRRLD